MTRPEIAWTVLADGPAGAETLVVGSSLGTAVEPLWTACAKRLAQRYRVVGWDLPGHGRSPIADGSFTVADLAEAVLAEWPSGRARYAGVSVGGATGLELALRAGGVAEAVAVMCSGAQIGSAQNWQDRADFVRRDGTAAMVDGSRQRWFSPESRTQLPGAVTELLDSLVAADDDSYARVCEALATYDVRDRLGEIDIPVLAVAGADDAVCPPQQAHDIVDGVRTGRAVVINHAAHLAPAEQPDAVADLLLAWGIEEGDET
ncbi:alpha/beta fold hydrolase [Allosaccharopolyspora coralli]|uniref:Alpha/beta fold hydrolase n=1 Tax=Allosaccharopolyspora coralli TaxID=2665642 RepID=A0A5Q3QFT9_9PSEU|nr:alpha/beta fold hydrolase [Allosaccharopolyspora coralli]